MITEQAHWIILKINNSMARIMCKIRRQTQVIGAFSDRGSVLMWVSASLHHIVSTLWVMCRYMSLDWLNEKDYGGSAYRLRNIVPKKSRKIIYTTKKLVTISIKSAGTCLVNHTPLFERKNWNPC